MKLDFMERIARQHTAASAINDFSFNLYSQVTRTDNLFFSPFSVYAALDVVHLGTSGKTADEIDRVLRLPSFSHGATAEISLGEDTDTANHLFLNNSLWAQKDQPFRESFLREIQQACNAHLGEVDFVGGPEEARKTINVFAKDKTGGKIDNLIPQGGVDALTRLVLTNTIYFRADWRHKFDPADTADAPFRLADGSKIEVPTMHLEEEFPAVKTDLFWAIELSYEPISMAMQIFVPRRVSDMEWLEHEMLRIGPTSRRLGMQWRRVTLSLPRFRLESSLLLANPLRELWIKSVFDRDRADFSAMTPAPGYWIQEMIHRAFIDVNEEGTEAAGATATMLTGGCPPPAPPLTLKIDRPFLLTICARPTLGGEDVVLFQGRVMNPVVG